MNAPIAEDVATVLAAVEARRIPRVRPATDPTNLAGLGADGDDIAAWADTLHTLARAAAWVPNRYGIDSTGRHTAPQSFETDRREYEADAKGIDRDHLGRHVAGGAA